MGLSLPKSNLIFLKKCLDKWVHFIYSIVETAKANNLKPFDYVQHLLEEIPKHMNDKDCSFLEDLLPWSEKLPAGIRKA